MRGFEASFVSGEGIALLRLGIDDVNLMSSTRKAGLNTTDHIEEGASEKNLKWGILDNLNLKIDGDQS